MAPQPSPLVITGLKVTPIALPDPPILAASGCHGPYFLRNIVELRAEGGIVGIGETHGGANVTKVLDQAGKGLVGQNAFGYRKFARALQAKNMAAYAAIEMACIDACARATGRRFCELVGGPVRDSVEFAAYLFYRYAADHPVILSDPRLVDSRGRGERALDSWGEVRTPDAMAAMAAKFRDQWGFRVFKLKGGVLDPDRRARDDEGPGSSGSARRLCCGSIPTGGGSKTPPCGSVRSWLKCRWNTMKIRFKARRRWPRFGSRLA